MSSKNKVRGSKADYWQVREVKRKVVGGSWSPGLEWRWNKVTTSKVENVAEAVTSFRLAFQTVRDLNGKNEIYAELNYLYCDWQQMKSAMISVYGQQIIFLCSCNFCLQSRLMWRPSPISWRLPFAKREAVAKDFLEAIICTSRLFEEKLHFQIILKAYNCHFTPSLYGKDPFTKSDECLEKGQRGRAGRVIFNPKIYVQQLYWY